MEKKKKPTIKSLQANCNHKDSIISTFEQNNKILRQEIEQLKKSINKNRYEAITEMLKGYGQLMQATAGRYG